MIFRLILVTLFIFYSCLIILEPQWRVTRPTVMYFDLFAHLIFFPCFFWAAGRVAMRSLKKTDWKVRKFVRECVKRNLYPLALNDLLLGPFIGYVTMVVAKTSDNDSFASFYRLDRYVVGSGIGWSLALLFIFNLVLGVVSKVVGRERLSMFCGTKNGIPVFLLVFLVIWASIFGFQLVEFGIHRNLRIFDLPYIAIHCMAFTLGCINQNNESSVCEDELPKTQNRNHSLTVFGTIIVSTAISLTSLISIPFINNPQNSIIISLLKTLVVFGMGTSVYLTRRVVANMVTTKETWALIKHFTKNLTSYLTFLFHTFLIALSLLIFINFSFFTEQSFWLKAIILFLCTSIISWLSCTLISWISDIIIKAFAERLKSGLNHTMNVYTQKFWRRR